MRKFRNEREKRDDGIDIILMAVKHFRIITVDLSMHDISEGNQLSLECRFYEFNPSCHFIFYLENFHLKS